MNSDFFRLHDQNFPNQLELSSVSTLLIPNHLYSRLITKYSKKKFAETFQTLISKYRNLISLGVFPRSNKVKMLYQKEGLDLQKLNFRPLSADWMELGILSYGIGLSRCHLFSIILEMEFGLIEEFARIVDTVGAPLPPVSQERKVWLLSGDRSEFKRNFYLKT